MTQALADSFVEVPPVPKPTKWPSGAARGITSVKYTHDSMIDYIIANPCILQDELAVIYGYTPSWISQVISSDTFQARLAERKDELTDPTIRASIEQHFKGLVSRSLAIISEKLDRPASQIPDHLALRSLELASRALGYGARPDPAPVQVNVINHLEDLGANLVQLLHRKKVEAQPIIEAEGTPL